MHSKIVASPNCTYVLLTRVPTKVLVWNVRTMECVHDFDPNTYSISSNVSADISNTHLAYIRQRGSFVFDMVVVNLKTMEKQIIPLRRFYLAIKWMDEPNMLILYDSTGRKIEIMNVETRTIVGAYSVPGDVLDIAYGSFLVLNFNQKKLSIVRVTPPKVMFVPVVIQSLRPDENLDFEVKKAFLVDFNRAVVCLKIEGHEPFWSVFTFFDGTPPIKTKLHDLDEETEMSVRIQIFPAGKNQAIFQSEVWNENHTELTTSAPYLINNLDKDKQTKTELRREWVDIWRDPIRDALICDDVIVFDVVLSDTIIILTMEQLQGKPVSLLRTIFCAED